MKPIALYSWILGQFVADGRRAEDALRTVGPHLEGMAGPGDRVMDLCCGGGPWSFFFEDRGAAVFGIDFAPDMIEEARRTAERRGSGVDFVQADVLVHELGEDRFDLVVLMGNTVADFAPRDLLSLLPRIHRSLKPGGMFAMQYIDGLMYFEDERIQDEVVEQEEPMRISRRYKEYRPEESAWVTTYVNLSTGEAYDYTTYLYPTGLLRLITESLFTLTRSTRISNRGFLDVYTKHEG